MVLHTVEVARAVSTSTVWTVDIRFTTVSLIPGAELLFLKKLSVMVFKY